MLQDYPFANEVFIRNWGGRMPEKMLMCSEVFCLSIEDDGVEEAETLNPNDIPPPIAPSSPPLNEDQFSAGYQSM